MKRSELKEFIKGEIVTSLSEASPEDVNNQKELNKELEKTAKLSKDLGLEEANVGLDDLQDIGYDDGEYAVNMHFNKDVIEKKIIKICDYLELKDRSFDGFVNWVLDLRKKLDMPHKLSEVIDEKDFDIDRLSKMALADPSTGGNPKKLTEDDMRIMYQNSMTGELFK